MTPIYNLRELVHEIQRPYWPNHPDGGEINPKRYPRWTLLKTLRELQRDDATDWQHMVLNRLRQINYVVPDYIHHPLVEYLVSEGALTVRRVQ